MSEPNRKPELLAPAGDMDCMRAAWENGADAVYFGIDSGFNARARAKNFSVGKAAEAIRELHRRGLAAYVTLNTLVFGDELADIERLIAQLAIANVDAFLVQDLGVARLARAICPDVALHASTQMTLSSAECIAAVRELGISRVVLPRESSLDDIRRVARETSMPLEAFIHGALCVAYSGQCLTSESLGGRSANRGQCAQACRMPYELVCDGRSVDLGDQKYLLSPQDLAAFRLIPELIAAGVCSFKIEGRLKTPEYVANITRHYRQAIDAACANSPFEFSPRDVYEMEMSFSRGFSPGWLEGCDHKRLVPGLSSAKRGVYLGRIESVHKRGIVTDLGCPVGRGDGVVFEGDRYRGEEQGGRVFEIFQNGESVAEAQTGTVELRFDRHAIDLRLLAPGKAIWKTDDPQLNRKLRTTFEAARPTRRVDLNLAIDAAEGSPLWVRATTTSGATAEIRSSDPLPAAIKHPLTETTLREQFSRLGESIYRLGELRVTIEGNPMVPLSVLGQMRRALIAQLDSWSERRRTVAAESVLPQLRAAISETATRSREVHAAAPKILVLVRNLSQLECVLEARVSDVYADFQDIRQYRVATEAARRAEASIWLATPRIQKPAEMGVFRAMLKHNADGILIRNLAGLEFFGRRDIPMIADFSLNVANELTAQFLMEKGPRRLTPSYDLNRDQLLDLVNTVPADWLEVVVHQHMPMFHMEHCVFCAVLSPGTNKTNCGRPCDRHTVQLRDSMGVEHPLTADVGCRNTLFNAACQSGAELVPRLIAGGVRFYRLEFVEESADEIRKALDLYRRLLHGEISGRQVWTELKAINRVGVTRGTWEERRDPLAII